MGAIGVKDEEVEDEVAEKGIFEGGGDLMGDFCMPGFRGGSGGGTVLDESSSASLGSSFSVGTKN